MIRIKFTIPTATGAFGKRTREFKNNLIQGMWDALYLIDSTIQGKYLRGPKPGRLEVDEGALSGAITKSIKASGSNEPGIIAKGRIGVTSGPALKYAHVHEQEGFRGTGFYIYAKKPGGMHFFWKQRGIMVHGARRVIIPARPFLRPAVEENIGRIQALFQAIIARNFSE